MMGGIGTVAARATTSINASALALPIFAVRILFALRRRFSRWH